MYFPVDEIPLDTNSAISLNFAAHGQGTLRSFLHSTVQITTKSIYHTALFLHLRKIRVMQFITAINRHCNIY